MTKLEAEARRIFAKHLDRDFPIRARVVRRSSELPLKERAAITAIMEALARRGSPICSTCRQT